MLIALTWSELTHEFGTLAAAIIAIACLGHLARKIMPLYGHQRQLLDQGIATGLLPKGTRGLGQPHRFNLFDLLVSVTLVAALAGLIRGIAYEKHDTWWWKNFPAEVNKQEPQIILLPIS